MKRPSQLIGVAGLTLAAYAFCVRPWHLRWGATDEEVDRRLPGDDLVLAPKVNATHAITIHASAREVWPWLVQIGQGRAGFYSYDWLENLMGLDIHSGDRVVPELQDVKVGDLIPLAPGGFDVPIADVQHERALVLHGDTRAGEAPKGMNLRPGDFYNVSWVFFLDPQEDGSVRLIERFKADYNSTVLNTFFNRAIVEPGSFIMEQKMLRGIKERAERLPRL